MLESVVTIFTAFLLLAYIRKRPDVITYRKFSRLLNDVDPEKYDYRISSEDYTTGKSGPEASILVYRLGKTSPMSDLTETQNDVILRKKIGVDAKNVTQANMSWKRLYEKIVEEIEYMKNCMEGKSANVQLNIDYMDELYYDL